MSTRRYSFSIANARIAEAAIAAISGTALIMNCTEPIAAIGSVQFMINAVPLIAAIAASAILAFAIEKEYRRVLIVCVCGAACACSFLPYLHSYLGADWNIV